MKNCTVFMFLFLCFFSMVGGGFQDGEAILTDGITPTLLNIDVSLTEHQLGSTAPTKQSLGTTPSVFGFLFNAVNELMQLQIHIPDDYVVNTDIDVVLHFYLDQNETAADDINWTTDYIVVGPAELVTKTSLQETATTIVAGGCATQGCNYSVTFVLDYTDANNPIAMNDAIVMEIHLTDVVDHAGVVLIAAEFHYTGRL